MNTVLAKWSGLSLIAIFMMAPAACLAQTGVVQLKFDVGPEAGHVKVVEVDFERPEHERGEQPHAEMIERRIHHLNVAAENMEAAGEREMAEKIRHEVEKMEHQLREMHRRREQELHRPEGTEHLMREITQLRREVQELKRVTAEMRQALEDMHRRLEQANERRGPEPENAQMRFRDRLNRFTRPGNFERGDAAAEEIEDFPLFIQEEFQEVPEVHEEKRTRQESDPQTFDDVEEAIAE